jgi:hypothetical protein
MSWTSIDNAQLPGWENVLRPVTIEETAVFGGSNFSSVAFASSITTTYSGVVAVAWANIDDSQTPGWTPINTV